ncbi:MAG: sugar ABC transporter permease [Planctomycetes bacterium]|nr:sugar ABC transporter permease [Planctomycetota bacterium]
MFKPYAFVLPALALLGLFSFGSMALSLWVSLHQWDPLMPEHRYTGMAHYERAVRDPLVRTALLNTLYYAALAVPLVAASSLALALLVGKVRRGQGILKTLFFLPSITPMVVIALIWVWMLRQDGPVNQTPRIVLGCLPQALKDFLGCSHFSGPNWLMDSRTAMPAIVLTGAWHAVGYYMVIFLAGLGDIPREFYEAARIDGANAWQELRFVTLPLLRNTVVFVLVTLVIGALQVFTQVYVMTGGGPEQSTEVLASVIFKKGFAHFGKMGYASAIAWLFFLFLLCLVLVQMRLMRSRRLYD